MTDDSAEYDPQIYYYIHMTVKETLYCLLKKSRFVKKL